MVVKEEKAVTMIMVEGENYIGCGCHFTLGSIAPMSKKDAAYLGGLRVKGKPQFVEYDPTTPMVKEEAPEVIKIPRQPTSRAGFVTSLDEWGVAYPQNATVTILRALWVKAASNNGSLNRGDMTAKDLNPTPERKGGNVEIKTAKNPGDVLGDEVEL